MSLQRVSEFCAAAVIALSCRPIRMTIAQWTTSTCRLVDSLQDPKAHNDTRQDLLELILMFETISRRVFVSFLTQSYASLYGCAHVGLLTSRHETLHTHRV